MGLKSSGKTTVFNALTNQHINPMEHVKEKYFMGTVFVKDDRIDYLSGIYHPKKTTYPEIHFIDYNIQNQEKSLNAEFIAKLKECDSIIKVIRSFNNEIYPPALHSVDPLKEIQEMDDEIILNDILTIEKRLEKLKNAKYKLSNSEENEKKILEKFHTILADNRFLYDSDLTEEEQKLARNYGLLSFKSEIIVINAENADYKPDIHLEEMLSKSKRDFVIISALEEVELNELDEESKKELAADMHINKFAVDKIAEKLYYGMHLITFLTSGEDEVKGWTIKNGTSALHAAGKIHSDIERGFIKAQIVSFEDFKQYGSIKECSTHGVYRLEGKEYVMKDGDMVEFKFNV